MPPDAEIREVTWSDVDDRWEGLITDCFHPAYAGLAETMAGVRTVRDKLKQMVRYRYAEQIRLWALEEEDDLLGLMVGRVVDGTFIILDLAVSEEARRRGIGSKLFEQVVKQTGCTRVIAEIRDDNRGSLALALANGFRVTMTVHLVEWQAPAGG
jgi:ribosomal protein S18 acetylase RimI-like enzyme